MKSHPRGRNGDGSQDRRWNAVEFRKQSPRNETDLAIALSYGMAAVVEFLEVLHQASDRD